MRQLKSLESAEIKNLFSKFQELDHYQGHCQHVKVVYNQFRVVQAAVENFHLAATVLLALMCGSDEFKRGLTRKFSHFINRRYDQHPLADDRILPGMVTISIG